MGLFGGRAKPESEDRALHQDIYPSYPIWTGDFASLNPANQGTALQSVAVRTTVDLLASLTSELPIDVYSGAGKQITTPGNLLDPGGDGQGAEDWLYRVLSSWALSGNAFGAATSMNATGRFVTTMDLFHPDDVTISLVGGAPQWHVVGRLFDDQSKFIHRRMNPVAGRVLGLSPIELHATQIGVSLSATRFGRQWFNDGAHPAGLLTNEARLADGDADQAKRRFMALTQGSREPLVLGKGWDFKEIQISPEESQFLATLGFSEAQCARMFGPGFAEILGYPTGDTMTYANIVDRRQDLLVLALNKWIRRCERILSLLTPAPQYVKLNRDALLEAAPLQRYEAHASALQNQWRTVNEVRDIEDLPPVPWGDKPTGPPAALSPALNAPKEQ